MKIIITSSEDIFYASYGEFSSQGDSLESAINNLVDSMSAKADEMQASSDAIKKVLGEPREAFQYILVPVK